MLNLFVSLCTCMYVGRSSWKHHRIHYACAMCKLLNHSDSSQRVCCTCFSRNATGCWNDNAGLNEIRRQRKIKYYMEPVRMQTGTHVFQWCWVVWCIALGDDLDVYR